MTPDEWKRTCDFVTEKMLLYTRPFVTPISTSNDINIRLVGSGSYVMVGNRRILITCKHVVDVIPVEYRFHDYESVFRYLSPFITDPKTDTAFAQVTDGQWNSVNHCSALIPYERFALTHHVVCNYELLFFSGFAGENSHYGFGYHEVNASGYCSQEKVVDKPDPKMFEIFWEPDKIEYTEAVTAETRRNMSHNNPHGFSGSLVWSTRYIEVTSAGRKWSPDDAVVTGLLYRFDDRTKTLLALRVEYLRDFIDKNT